MFEVENPYRHFDCRVNDRITWGGYRAILLQNDLLQIVILIDKGSEIVQFLYKPYDIDFLWHSENPMKQPGMFNLGGKSTQSDFFDYWTGGWFEVLPNGGPGCSFKGVNFSQFAETINVPWNYKILVDNPDEVKVGLWLYTSRTPFIIKKTLTMKLHLSALFIEEEVFNCGHEPVEFMWGHHPVIGSPFLSSDCKLFAPKCTVEVRGAEDGPDHRMGLNQQCVWPYIKDRDGAMLNLQDIPSHKIQSMDNCYLKDFSEGWIAVSRPDIGFGLAWDPQVFKYIWLWQAFGGGKGYPWYGRTYNMGIEPWSSYPCVGLQEASEMGTTIKLLPKGKISAWVTAVVFEGKSAINGISRDGQIVIN